jgi:hypothetical protein
MANPYTAAAEISLLDIDPYPLMPANMPAQSIAKGFGVCDPQFRDIRQAAENWRFATAYLTLVAAAGDLTIAASQTVATLFDYGIDQSLAGQGFAAATLATSSDTDLNSEGAPVKEDQSFVAVAMSVDVQRCFTSAGTQTKVYPQWLDAYQGRIAQVFMENFALQFAFGDEACKYQVGTFGMYPPAGGALSSESRMRNGAGIGPAQLMPFRRPIAMGARDSSDQLSIVIQNGWGITISGDPIVPVPAEVTAVRVPVLIQLYGLPVCKPCNASCAPSGPMDVRAMLNAMASDPVAARQLAALIAQQNRG